jgi:hypothetical protein
MPLMVDVIVNFDLPTDDEMYLNRMAFCVSEFRKFVRINLCDCDEIERICQIESFHKGQIEEITNDLAQVLPQTADSANAPAFPK